MRCERCGGFQLKLHFMYQKGSTAPWEYDGWLCLNCGEIVDPLILLNRMVQGRLKVQIPPRPYDGGKVVWVQQRDDIVA